MPPKPKDTSKSRSKSRKKGETTPPPPVELPPDPVEIARKLRLAEKHKRLEQLQKNSERLIHIGYDNRQYVEHCKTFITHMESEISNEVKPYRKRRIDIYRDVNDRFVAHATKYSTFLGENRDALQKKYNDIVARLTGELDALAEKEDKLIETLQKLQYLKEIKEQQQNKIAELQKLLTKTKKKTRTEAQKIRLRHARWRARDLEGRAHRLKIVSDHLEEETEPYFIFRLESKREDNRRLLSRITDRVNGIKHFQTLRRQLELKDREMTFEYEYLSKYKKEAAAKLRELPPLTEKSLANAVRIQNAARDEMLTWSNGAGDHLLAMKDAQNAEQTHQLVNVNPGPPTVTKWGREKNMLNNQAEVDKQEGEHTFLKMGMSIDKAANGADAESQMTELYAGFCGQMGNTCAMAFAALGASYGTAKSGTAIAGMSVMRPDLIMKSLIPVIMAGIIAIYGLVVAVIISSAFGDDIIKYSPVKGFVHLGAGLSVGLCGTAAGYAIGETGSAGVIRTALQPRLFIGMVLVLIFAEVLGLYGLIIALIMTSSSVMQEQTSA